MFDTLDHSLCEGLPFPSARSLSDTLTHRSSGTPPETLSPSHEIATSTRNRTFTLQAPPPIAKYGGYGPSSPITRQIAVLAAFSFDIDGAKVTWGSRVGVQAEVRPRAGIAQVSCWRFAVFARFAAVGDDRKA